MEIEFLKMQGCGDDVVLVDCFKQPAPDEASLAPLARRILDRSRGVGANSLLVLAPGNREKLSARSFLSSGSRTPVSLNALRCAARYASDSGASNEERFTIETPEADIIVEIIDSVNVRVDMGKPAGGNGTAEIREKPLESFTRTLVMEGRSVTYTPVVFGASYAVVFVTAFDFPFARTSRMTARHRDFPDETGICFAQVYNREEIRLRVWEAEHNAGEGPRRGGHEGPASCAGAASAVVASVVNGFTDREVFVHLQGGDVFLQWEESDNRLLLTGPASYVFTGAFYMEEDPRNGLHR
jgi:diaminopimelate epimerase